MSVLITGIDIPNTMAFRLSFDCGTVFFQPVDKTPRRVYDAKVIQLPAEHGRLIDADALIIDLMDRGIEGLQTDDWHEIQQAVADSPTVIEAEVSE